MKIGCIGYGNMATAIIGGMLKEQAVLPADVFVYDVAVERLEVATQQEMIAKSTIEELVSEADIVLLSVKSKDFTGVLNSIKLALNKNIVFITIAAGISIEFITNILGPQTPVVRTMPNTPLLLGQGTTAICRNAAVSDSEFVFAKQMFACAGTIYELPESQFDHVINLNGSSPAYIYLFAKTIAEFAAQQGGIPFETCLAMVCDTLKGSAEMLQHSGKTPDDLIRAVSSPGGTTVAALEAFEANGFSKSLQAGLQACLDRAKEMAEQYAQ